MACRRLRLWSRDWLALVVAVASVVAFQVDEDIQLPEGFHIQSFVNGTTVPEARTLALSGSSDNSQTILYVSTRKLSNVYAVIDDDGDGVADRVHVVVDDQESPNGIAWRDGALYVATPLQVLRYDDVDDHALAGRKFKEPEVVRDGFVRGEDHYWRYISFSPDDRLFLSVGIDCNICEPVRNGKIVDGTIIAMQPDGSELEVFASGVRNSVGFDWHPVSGDFFFTENGADELGNNRPDDVLYSSSEAGMDFGFPYCHVKGSGNPRRRSLGKHRFLSDATFGNNCDVRNQVGPVQALGPHVAALGMRFYKGDMFPEKYKNSIFIAEHGSWNRDKKIGFRVVNLKLDDDNKTVVDHEIFAQGWELDEVAFGRPVDVQELPDGSLLVSDDDANDIYRIFYSKKT